MNGVGSKTRFVLIGGFLGAGKTTLIGQLAKQYAAAGKRVGIITNDQADNLVDTQNLRSQGFDVGEVAGACFCCSFDDLVATADQLSGDQVPDVLLAEPVGSCTDLVATVILPLQQILGDRFELAPFGVLLKPSHGARILSDSKRSGFSPQAEYIFRKQLEEADYLMIGRSDQLDASEMDTLRMVLASAAIDVPIVAVSPKTGAGVDEVLGYIESPMQAGRRLLEIDYDTYADGEAELGWVNLSAMLSAPDSFSLDAFVQSLVRAIADQIVKDESNQIAHLKASILAGETQSVANVVSNDSEVDMGLISGRSATGMFQVIVNARVAMDPEVLERICRDSVSSLAGTNGMTSESIQAQSLRPGRPQPTHRLTRE
jgi:Ni2+-binding GTPase involved in maturation of urease and hydrogenase